LVVEVLSDAECRSFLGRSTVGRVGVTIDALPVILPVNFALVEGAVVFRTTPGTKLSAALQGAVVAFEADDYDPNGDRGWSVVVQGTAAEVTDADRIARLRALPLRIISARGEGDHFVEIPITNVTGRRIRPSYAT